MNQNNVSTKAQEVETISHQSKAPRIVLATTMSAVMVMSNPSVASAENGIPVRPYGISGGQGTDHLTPAPKHSIELESTKPIQAPKRRVQTRNKNTKSPAQRAETNNSSRYEILLQKSKIVSSPSEVLFFGQYFGVNPKNPEAFIKKVQAVQKQAGFSKKDQDGIIGPGTLKMLYTKYYKNAKKLPKDIQVRLENTRIANRYRQKGHHMDPYSRGAHLGLSGTTNIPNTYFDAHLYSHLPGEKNAKKYRLPVSKKHTPNTAVIRKIKQEGKYVFAFYDSKGQLRVLSYTSPGRDGTRWDKKVGKRKSTRSTRGKFITDERAIKNYVSKAFEVPMPNALFFNWKVGEAIHGSDKVSGKLASSGCARLPYLYAGGMAQYANGQNITVDTRGITY